MLGDETLNEKDSLCPHQPESHKDPEKGVSQQGHGGILRAVIFLILHRRIKCESRERGERQCVLLDPAQGRGLGLKQFRLTWSLEAKRPPGRELRFGLRVPCPIHLSFPVLLSCVPECEGDSSTLSC